LEEKRHTMKQIIVADLMMHKMTMGFKRKSIRNANNSTMTSMSMSRKDSLGTAKTMALSMKKVASQESQLMKECDKKTRKKSIQFQ